MHARLLAAAALALSAVAAEPAVTPAEAHGRHGQPPFPVQAYPGHWGGPFGAWYGGWQPQVVVNVPNAATPTQGGYYDGQNLDRDSWLRECRRRLGDNGVGGALIGGVAGGVAGNVIAGRGNRTLGTVAGAVVGAVAGAAIDKAEDRTRVQDRCEAMLANPAASGYAPAGYGTGYGAGYGYGVPVMMVPVMMVPAPVVPGTTAPQATPCRETVTTEEYYVTVPRRRVIIERVPDKRVRLVPDKRVRR